MVFALHVHDAARTLAHTAFACMVVILLHVHHGVFTESVAYGAWPHHPTWDFCSALTSTCIGMLQVHSCKKH